MKLKYSRDLSKDVRRMDKIRSFEFLAPPSTPVVQFIPTQETPRDALYAEYKDDGVVLPPYSSFKRKALRKRDMLVLDKDIEIRFKYDGQEYKMKFDRGYCFDGASVPVAFVFGNVSKFNQYVLLAAMIHDGFFALKLLPFEDANNVFSAILRYQRINWFALGRYMLGVRSFVGRRLYRKSDPAKSWLRGFVEFIHLV